MYEKMHGYYIFGWMFNHIIASLSMARWKVCYDNVHSLLARAATLGARLMKLVMIELGTLFSS